MAAKAAVLAVIRNRASDSANRWPKTTADVVTQPKQFSSFNASDPNVTKWPTPRIPVEWSAWQDSMTVVETPLTADPTDGANHYHSLPDGSVLPSWADPAKLTVTIGPFKFYKL
jgi:spore germination cell wall hydrolase CwlJ-like protein